MTKSLKQLKPLKILISIAVITVVVGAILHFTSKPAKADWFDEGWAYRKSLSFVNSGSAVTNQMVKMQIDTATLITAGKLQSSCQDARFTDANGALLQYYINVGGGAGVGCNDASSDFYVLMPNIPVGGNLLYFYYGNPNASAGTQAATFAVTEFTTGTVTTGSESAGPGPVAYWKFDEGTGTTTKSVTANTLTGTLSGTTIPTWNTEDLCLSGKCLYYDGSTSHTAVSDPGTASVLDFTSGDSITLESWVNPNSLPANGGYANIVAKGSTDGTQDTTFALQIGNSSGKYFIAFCYASSGGSSIDECWESDHNTSLFTTNTWQHIALTFTYGTGSSIKAYYNGRDVSQGSWTTGDGNAGPKATNKDLWIGADQYTGSTPLDQVNGKIDDVKIYRYARTATQIKSDYIARGTSKGSSAVLGSSISDLGSNLGNGLVGYWKMDEADWTNDCSTLTALDSSGNSLGGKSCSSTTGPDPTTGKFGNSANLDGSNDYVEVADNSTLEPSNDLTVSVWFNLTTLAGTRAEDADFVVKRHSVSPFESYSLYQRGSDNMLRFEWVNNSSTAFSQQAQQSNVNIQTGVWYHLVGVKSGSSMKMYLNGKDISESSPSPSGTILDSDTALRLGASNATSARMLGKLDEVRIYNRGLSGAEVNQLYSWAPGPVGYWNMDENTGTTAKDSSGYGNDCTLTGTPSWRSGKVGSAMNFSGTSMVFGCQDLTSTQDLKTFTAEAWVYPRTLGQTNEAVIIGKLQGGDNNGWALTTTNAGGTNNFRLMIARGTTDLITTTGDGSTDTLNFNTWQHVTVVYDNSLVSANVKFYINGQLTTHFGDQNGSGTRQSDSGFNLGIGNIADARGQAFNGLIDDARIYNYARTAKQIVQDMNGSHPTGGSPVGSQAFYYKLDEQNGTTAHDSGYVGTSGTVSSATLWKLPNSCKVNGCLNISGTSDNVAISDPAIFAPSMASMSASFWINPQTLTASREILSKSNINQETFKIETWSTASELKISIASSVTTITDYYATSSLGLVANAWQHITVVYDSSQPNTKRIQVYRNGVLAGGGVNGTIPGSLTDSSADLRIGQSQGGTSALSTYIDEVKIYPYALNQTDINLDMNNGSAVAMGGVLGTHDDEGFSMPVPAAWWKMDENSGSTLVDASGTTRTFSFTNGPKFVPGQTGSGLSFSNTLSRADEANSAISNSTAFTISVWVNYTSTVTGNIFREYNSPSGNGKIILKTSDGAIPGDIGWSVTDDASVTGFNETGVALNDGKWHHIVGVQNSKSSRTFYLDGKVVDSDTTTVGTLTTNNTILGINSDNVTDHYSGMEDDLRIYSSALTQAQVTYLFSRGAPAYWWKMDECQGNQLHDYVSNALTGTITPNANTYTAVGTCGSGSGTEMWNAGTTGKFNSALGFDGSDDYVDLPVISLANHQDLSISAWVKYAGGGAISAILAGCNEAATPTCSGNDYDGIYFIKNASDQIQFSVYYFRSGGGRCTFITSSAIPLNQWVNVTATYDENDASGIGSIYFNGVKQPLGAESCASNVSKAISVYDAIGAVKDSNNGASSAFSSPMNGLIDDLRIYLYPLTATQVKNVYNYGSAFFGPLTGAP